MKSSARLSSQRPIGKRKINWSMLSKASTIALPQIGYILLIGLSLALWFTSLKAVDVRAMNDLGLISVLPLAILEALAILSVSFCLALSQRKLTAPILLLHVVILIFMLYGITTLVEETPRFSTTYKHVGIVEYIQRNHSVDTKINAYFNWPGFFSLGAFFTEISGIQSALNITDWSSVYFNLFYLGPLFMIFDALTGNKRLVWLSIWFFYITNWIGQDTFAPQALNYFFFLLVLAILLRWFKPGRAETLWVYRGHSKWIQRGVDKINKLIIHTDRPAPAYSPAQRTFLMAFLILFLTFMIPSHQLTPFALLSVVTALVIFKQSSARGLPIILGIMIMAWLAFMTTDFLVGHSHMVIGAIGEVDAAVSENVVERVQGSAEHVFIVRMRLVMSAVLWALATLGLVRRLQKGYLDLTAALIAIAPFPLLAAALYGGEMILRVYFFSLPAMVFLAAAFFYPTIQSGLTWRTTLMVSLTSMILIGGFQFTRYGNERMDYFTANELEAMSYLYQFAEPNTQFVAISTNTPWRYEDFELHSIVDIKGKTIRDLDIDAIVGRMEDKRFSGSYLVITRSQLVHATMFSGIPDETLEEFEKSLLASRKFRVFYRNSDAVIFVLADDKVIGGQGN